MGVGNVGRSNDRNEGFTIKSELRSRERLNVTSMIPDYRVRSEKSSMESKEQIEEGNK